MLFRPINRYTISTICALLLALPSVSQAAPNAALEAMRAQLQSLSARLDRLEAENKNLQASNAELSRSHQETAKTVAEINEKTAAIAAETSWTDTIRWKGDFRYRYEGFDIENKSSRNRNRIRARVALLANVTPTVEVGLGMASGGTDPVSTNQTLGNGGSTKGFNLDMAYFDWSGLNNTHIIAGKFKNFLKDFAGLLWDDDWRPEGAGFRWANDRLFFSGIGTWIESDNKKDQLFANGLQGGITVPIGDNMKLTAGASYFKFDTRGSGTFYGKSTDFFGNSFDPATNTYLNDYRETELFANLGMNVADRPLKVFADWVQNQDADRYDTGYTFGFKYGKAANQGQWEFGYFYKRVEADAVFGLLNDSDFGGGGTDSKGHVIKGSYALAKHVNANFAYFINDQNLKSSDSINFKRLQLDLKFKF